jgi:hypothetical protein
LGSNLFFRQIRNFEEYVDDLGLLDHLKIPTKETPLLVASWIESLCITAEEGEAVAASSFPYLTMVLHMLGREESIEVTINVAAITVRSLRIDRFCWRVS